MLLWFIMDILIGHHICLSTISFVTLAPTWEHFPQLTIIVLYSIIRGKYRNMCTGTWYRNMGTGTCVQEHGYRNMCTGTWVQERGTGTWYRNMVQEHGYRNMVQEHGTGTWVQEHVLLSALQILIKSCQIVPGPPVWLQSEIFCYAWESFTWRATVASGLFRLDWLNDKWV
jgi:hypothetical protein